MPANVLLAAGLDPVTEAIIICGVTGLLLWLGVAIVLFENQEGDESGHKH